jgi:hypothetical protein
MLFVLRHVVRGDVFGPLAIIRSRSAGWACSSSS